MTSYWRTSGPYVQELLYRNLSLQGWHSFGEKKEWNKYFSHRTKLEYWTGNWSRPPLLTQYQLHKRRVHISLPPSLNLSISGWAGAPPPPLPRRKASHFLQQCNCKFATKVTTAKARKEGRGRAFCNYFALLQQSDQLYTPLIYRGKFHRRRDGTYKMSHEMRCVNKATFINIWRTV